MSAPCAPVADPAAAGDASPSLSLAPSLLPLAPSLQPLQPLRPLRPLRCGSRSQPRRRGAWAALLALTPACALAGLIQVDVVDQHGAPVGDAVVTASPTSGKPAPKIAGKAVIDQVHKQFVPLVSVVQTGTLVTFPNKDNIAHDVYSFSPPKVFELNLYSGVAAKPVEFDQPGLVVLGCNIHDRMIAYVDVVDTPYFAKTDATGHAEIADLPADSYDVTAWSYRATATLHLAVRVDNMATAHFVLQLPSS